MRPLPRPTPETQHFWDGTRAGELRLQRCRSCQTVYFPPRPFCPDCNADDVEVFAASGRARLYSYVISHLPAPGFEPPHAIALVELEEGPRLLSNLIGVETTPEALELDMPLRVVFETFADSNSGHEIALPLFARREQA
jgi:uncharacterized OB-fold protein